MKAFMNWCSSVKRAIDDNPFEVAAAFGFASFIFIALLSISALLISEGDGWLLAIPFFFWVLWRLFRFVIEGVAAVNEKIEDRTGVKTDKEWEL